MISNSSSSLNLGRNVNVSSTMNEYLHLNSNLAPKGGGITFSMQRWCVGDEMGNGVFF